MLDLDGDSVGFGGQSVWRDKLETEEQDKGGQISISSLKLV